MSNTYLKKDRLKFGFLWMFIFAGASYLVSLIGINWLATILMIFAGLSVITGLFGTNDDSKNEKVLMCPNCQVGNQMFNLNNNPESTIFIYNQHQPRIRASDGLHIFPLICLASSSDFSFINASIIKHSCTPNSEICLNRPISP